MTAPVDSRKGKRSREARRTPSSPIGLYVTMWRDAEQGAGAVLGTADEVAIGRAMRVGVDAVQRLGVRSTVIESPLSDKRLSGHGVSRGPLCQWVVGESAYAVANGRRATVAHEIEE